ncbi:Sodium/calcium exchanger membrane region [Dillenia turbinata]|uniref:Sodium/calcium exchanger membrane region n=1 Tax=Dillenia turbinata TaxID=194707 RepID=A0AAN8URE4_9MAGN
MPMASKLVYFLPLFSLILLLLAATGESSNTSSTNGVPSVSRPLADYLINLINLISSETCEETYGFLPCTNTVLGNIFLILVYGYIMFFAAKCLSNGCEALLEILGPGIVGGLFLPVLSCLPDTIIILASGLSGSTETAQSQVSVGMGLLAGSTVMLLTLLWGSCVVVGKWDLEESFSGGPKDTKGFNLTGSGVRTDIWTCYAARIMAISVIPFIIAQLPQVLKTTSQSRIAVLAALIVSVSLLVSYCLYQVFQPWIQRRRLAFAKRKHVMSGILQHMRRHALGRLLTDAGEPNIEVIEKMFRLIDVNQDGYLSANELRALIIGIQFEEVNLDIDDAVNKIMEDFDTSQDHRIDVNEFIQGISRWLDEAKHTTGYGTENDHLTGKFIQDFHVQTKQEHALLGDKDEEVEQLTNPKWEAFKAVLVLLLGTIIAGVFADPLVDAVDNFSTASGIPSFFVSFVVLPFASSSETVSSLVFASRKRLRMISLTFSQIYGSVTMSNILSLSVFLALVYFRNLTWDFSSEVLVILVVCIIMGAFASFRTTFPLWTCLVSFALYPLSIVLVYVLDYVFGWS